MRVGRALQIWVVVCVVLVATLLLWSEGEPVCEGPLILDVDDSDPPQCDRPIVGLIDQAPFILLFTAFAAAAVEFVLVMVQNVRSRR
jgi:hypothetical protein